MPAGLAVPDHNVPTTDRHNITDRVSRLQLETLDKNCEDTGITKFEMSDPRQGIVHVIGPEQGACLPGMTIVCGDSHTSTNGALGAACIWYRHLGSRTCTGNRKHWFYVRLKTCVLMSMVKLLPVSVPRILYWPLLVKLVQRGGTGYAIEFAGEAITDLSMEGRMTVCNMAIEAGARAGMIAVDEKTIEYVKGRPYSPSADDWQQAVDYWQQFSSDNDANFDHEININAESIKPRVTWGTSPEMVISVDDKVPNPAEESDLVKREGMERALKYMDFAGRHTYIQCFDR